MNPSLLGKLPNPAYLRLFEYQRQRMAYPAYHVDSPLLFFILFSRIAAGLSILSIFFPPSLLLMSTAFFCMVLATAASITHLTIPARFLAMIINHRSPIVWEIRLAGALTGSLGAQLLSRIGILPGFETFLLWTSFSLSIFFLISTGWAYRFHTHPAWKTDILPGYYMASSSMIGFALYSILYPNRFFGLITFTLLCAEAFLIFLYLNHLRKTSQISLKRIVSGKDRLLSLSFLVSLFFLPGLLIFAQLFSKNLEPYSVVLALSSGVGVVFERILFFRLEQPIFFLSRSQSPESNRGLAHRTP
jgi:DMSO reductase anchor subunit